MRRITVIALFGLASCVTAVQATDLNVAIEAEVADFVARAGEFFNSGASGCNVTVPFKGQACAMADSVSNRARVADAANTLTRTGESGLAADNTDGRGLVHDLVDLQGRYLADERIAIIGAGGATAGILFDLLAANPAGITIFNRTLSKAETLADRYPLKG